MVESQDSLYNMDSQEFNLYQIPTEELLASPEDHNTAERILTLSPNSLCAGFHIQSSNMTFIDNNGLAVIYPDTSHCEKLPIVEEMKTDWNFDAELHAESAGKTSWMYSQKLNKVFVKINTHLNVYLKYDMIDPMQQLLVRGMIVYTSTNDLMEPVKKCPNHRDQCSLANPEHILRCATSETSYVGIESGKLFKDRLAIIVPMNAIASNEPLKLQFTCQNSCSGGMNRKATSIVFTLENLNGEILGRKIMNFKVCSCPKRDKDKDEEGVVKTMPKKRKLEPTAPSTSKKVATTVAVVKQEQLEVSDGPLLSALPSDLQSLNSGLLDFKKESSNEVHIAMPNPEMAMEILKLAYDKIAGEMFRTGDGATYQPFLNNIKKQLDDN